MAYTLMEAYAMSNTELRDALNRARTDLLAARAALDDAAEALHNHGSMVCAGAASAAAAHAERAAIRAQDVLDG